MNRKQPKRKPRPGVDEYGRTTLHNAVVDRDIATVQQQLDAGADVNAQDDEGWTALHYAAQNHSLEIGTLLVAAGATIDLQDSNGNTPLWRAVMNSSLGNEFVVFLKESGADPHIKNNYDMSAHDLETDSE